MKGIRNVKQGFTLLEMLVVVLIIGILAAIAIPQYQTAVTKAKVASILPLMRRWKDAFTEYQLQHGSNYDDLDQETGGADLGVNWPADWKNGLTNEACGDSLICCNDYWCCSASPTSAENGYVLCYHELNDGSAYVIGMYQPDDPNFEELRNLVTCECDGEGTESEKFCKALGGKLLDVEGASGVAYKLN